MRGLRRLLGPGLGGRLMRAPALDIVQQLGGPSARGVRAQPAAAPWLILEARGRPELSDGYHALRRREFVARQGLFTRDDRDDADHDPSARVLVAVAPDGRLLGGVRIHPAAEGGAAIGWWRGSRLVVDSESGAQRGRIGAALVRSACAHALDAGALRFDAHVQPRQVGFFARLGWSEVRDIAVAGAPHRLMRWDVGRFRELARATKEPLGRLLGPLLGSGEWRGDDGVPVPGSDVVSCVDAITPSIVARDPEWAGWCGMLVTAHDLAAMGAEPVGALDALAAPDIAHAELVLAGARRAADALSLPILGGHTQLGAPAALAVTGLGHAARPVPGAGGRVGDAVTLTADLAGGWRPGYAGRQWDSSSWRTREQLEPMLSAVRRTRPRAAKDVSMAGVVGTLGMLAEASGTGAELEMSAIPRPPEAELADWLTCFPGFAMLTCDQAGAAAAPAGEAVAARCGTLVAQPGVRLRWPDGELTEALAGPEVSGLGPAVPADGSAAR